MKLQPVFDWSKMSDKERDAIVSEAVFERKFEKPRHGTCCTCQHCGWDYNSCIGCNYTTDITDALMVFEELVGNNYDGFAIRRWGEDTWDATFDIDQEEGTPTYGSGLCPSIPEAVCKAALRSKGYEIKEGS
jgi:hypothetical protein